MEILIVIAVILIFYEVNCSIYPKKCFNNLDIELGFKDKAIFEGEETELFQKIANNKWMPLWWIKIQYVISANIKYENEIETKGRKDKSKIEEFGLLGYEKVERKTKITGSKRGCYKIYDLEAISADLFVKNMVIKKCDNNQEELCVFPRQLDSSQFFIKFDNLLGDVITRRQLIQDPFEMNGIRDYCQFDNLKDINWKASAKSGSLKVNKYNFTANEDVVIFFTGARENGWVDDKTMEEAIRLVSTINTELSKLGITVALVTDCVNNNEEINVISGYGEEHDFLFNRALAEIDLSNNEYGLSEKMEREFLKGDRNPLWIVISNYTGNKLKSSILNSEKEGYDVKWIVVQDKNIKPPILEFDNLILWEVV